MASLDNFRTSNWVKRLNRVAQVVLALMLFAGINHLATRFYLREDLTRQGIYSLSPETVAYLRELREPVEIVVTIPEETAEDEKALLYRYVKNLLEEYKHYSRVGGEEMIRLEFVDPFRQLRRAEELASRYNVDQPYVVIFASGGRQRVVLPTEILEFQDLRPSAFRGEQAFTSALLEVSTGAAPQIYFISGHGEMDVDSVAPNRGLSAIAQELKGRNLNVLRVDLSNSDVPEDADLLIMVDPQGPALPEEVERLRHYLVERDGRVLLLLGPGREHGLDGLLGRWGVRTPDMVVLEQGGDYLESAGSILIRSFADHPITVPLIQNRAPVLAGLARPVLTEAGTPATLKLTPLLASSSTSWAERAWRQDGTPTFDADYDLKGPVHLGMISEMGGAAPLGITVRGGRLAVVGIGDLVANRRVSAFGNHTFFMSLVNWMLDREQVIAMPPRPVERHQLPLSRDDLRNVLLMLLIPAGVAGFLGLAIAAFRRY